MIDANHCELCEAPLVIESDGRRLKFTAHTDDYCRAATLARIRMLEAAMKRHILGEAVAYQELHVVGSRARRYEESLRGSWRALASIAGRMVDGDTQLSEVLELNSEIAESLTPAPTSRTELDLARAAEVHAKPNPD